MYIQKQKIDNVNKVALSASGKTLAGFCEKKKIVKIYRLFKGYYEIKLVIPINNVSKISVSDNTLIIGDNFNNCIYVYKRDKNNWIKEATLEEDNMNFGTSMSISSDGKTFIVGGVYNQDNDEGIVYIFNKKDVWSKQHTFTLKHPEDYFYYGNSVDINSDGTVAVIGFYRSSGKNGANEGTSYVFTKNEDNWLIKELKPKDLEKFSYYGDSVAINEKGDVVIVGASGKDAAYVYKKSGNRWINRNKLVPNETVHNYGKSVAISPDGTVAAVGTNDGFIYLYSFIKSKIEETKLFIKDKSVYFDSTAISFDNNILITSTGNDITGGDTYIFVKSSD